jgi:hypothetical protein
MFGRRRALVLSIDDPRWHDLWTAYSAPRRFLPALGRLWDNPAAGRAVAHEFTAENYVCHQCSVYHTTLAVVPHFVRAAARVSPGERRELLATAGFYALLLGVPLRPERDWPEPPGWLVEDYHTAVQDARSLTGEAMAAPLAGADPERDQLGLMAGLAGFHGQRRVGWLLVRASAWDCHCRHCGAEFDALAEWGKEY